MLISDKKDRQKMWFILLMAVIAAVYGLGMVANIIGYFFLFIGLGIAALVALIVIGAVLADGN
jgi:uncharacterized membrane protein YhaH (DUF805 family)